MLEEVREPKSCRECKHLESEYYGEMEYKCSLIWHLYQIEYKVDDINNTCDHCPYRNKNFLNSLNEIAGQIE